MAVSKAQQKAVAKYMQANYDELKVRMPKGKKPEFQSHAQEMGESLNAFINRAMQTQMERDKIAEADTDIDQMSQLDTPIETPEYSISSDGANRAEG